MCVRRERKIVWIEGLYPGFPMIIIDSGSPGEISETAHTEPWILYRNGATCVPA